MTTENIIRAQARAISKYWAGRIVGALPDDYADYVRSVVGKTVIVEVRQTSQSFVRVTESITGRRANAIIRRGQNAWLEA